LLLQIQIRGEKVEEGEGLAGWLLNDTLTAIQINQTLAELQKASTGINQTTDSLKTFIGNLNAGKGALPSLMYDTTMLIDLRQTLQNLNSGTEKFDENMEAFKHNFFTRGYFKKQEKEKKK
jgi:phospholipid/cholesterol/gamma-HCH transport system substrate-binding protein